MFSVFNMKKVKYTAQQIADFFINLANHQYIDDNMPEGITNLKLQKILYFAQAAYLSIHKEPLFEDDFVAWKYGPVINSIYNEFRQYGNEALSVNGKFNISDFDQELCNFLKSIWSIYGKYSAYELVGISHDHGPWRNARENEIISKESMLDYYKGYFEPENG